MNVWIGALVFGLLIIIVLLLIKLYLLKKSAKEINKSFGEKIKNDTNTLIHISSHDADMKELASSLNIQLKCFNQSRLKYKHGDLELKEAVTNISHDLRTPLTAISGYLDLLDKEEKSDTVNRYIETIKNRIEAMKQLTDELFQYSIVISADYDLPMEKLSINNVLEESILEFYGVLKQKKITPNIRITENKIVRNANRGALSRIFSNLMSNAIKYSDGDLEITLTDTGEIIFSNLALNLSDMEVERLFDRFYTVENARKSTGLGLSISRILIGKMNGEITAQYKKSRLSICVQLPEN